MYSFHLFLISSASTRSLPFLYFIVPIFGQNAPLIFGVFLKTSLEPFPFCFLLLLSIAHWRRPSCLFQLFFGTLCLISCTFPSLPCFSLLFILPLFVKPPQITTFSSCFLFGVFVCLGWFCLQPPVQYYRPLSIVLQVLHLLDLTPWIYSTPTYIYIYIKCQFVY